MPVSFMTLTEKILARAAGKAQVSAGENVWVKADVLMTHDVCGPGTIGVFKREFGKGTLTIRDSDCTLFQGLPSEIQVWNSHGDKLTKIPEVGQIDSMPISSAIPRSSAYPRTRSR